jgi:hypothetical protein
MKAVPIPPTCMGCGGDPKTGPGHPPLLEGVDYCKTCYEILLELMFEGKVTQGMQAVEISKIVKRRLAKKRADWSLSAVRATCPRCKRILEVVKKRVSAGAGLWQDEFVLQAHDVAPMLRQVCPGSNEPVSYEGAFAAAAEVVRLTKWLRAIAHTPHLGCDKAPTTGLEVLEQVEKSGDVHGKGENPNCGTCRAQAALSGREAP